MNQEVNAYINNLEQWKEELSLLRSVMLECGLTETYKWMHPCYTYNGNNVLLLHEFKDYCAILFHKGALLEDSQKILKQQTENTQAARQLRFTSILEIKPLIPMIKQYVFEAIEIEKAGLKVKMKSLADYHTPDELTEKFNTDPEFELAFTALTPGRQKGYLLHFSKPKHAKTRMSRIENCEKRIYMGKGLTDCICGHSKRMPNCDGSHKLFN